MTENEIENKNFLLKGIEHVFLKFKGVNDKKINQQEVTPKIEKDIQSEQSERLLKINEQEKQASKFLDANLPHLYFAMVNNGYEPTEIQNTAINQRFNHLVHSLEQSNNINSIKKFVVQGYKLTVDNVYQLITSNYFQKNFLNKDFFDKNISLESYAIDPTTFKTSIVGYESLLTNIRDVIFSDSFGNYAGQKILNILSKNKASNDDYNEYNGYYEDYNFDIKEIEHIPTILKNMPHLVLPHMNVDQFINFISQWHNEKPFIVDLIDNSNGRDKLLKYYKLTNFVENTEELLNPLLEQYFSNDIKNMLDTTKGLYSNNYLEEKAIKTNQTLSQNYKVSNLPKDTQNIIQEIQSVHTHLQIDKSNLNEDQVFLIDNLFDKRIPEVLQTYFSINEDYRTNMKNRDGKNAQDLMNDSLLNFKNKLTQTLDDVNQNKLSQLSVSNRYSKKI